MPTDKIVRTIKTDRSHEPVTYISPGIILERVSKATKVRKKDLRMVINAFGEALRDALLAGESVTITHLGRIEHVVKHQCRYNPLTKTVMERRPYPRLIFLPLTTTRLALKRAINEQRERRLCESTVTEPESTPTEDRTSEI